MQMDAGAVGITCQKLGEVEVMADAGVADDILLTYNVLGGAKTERLAALIRLAALPCIPAALICTLAALPPAGASAAEPSGLTAQALPQRLSAPGATTVSGKLTLPAGMSDGGMLELQLDARPFKRFANVAHTLTATDGSYRFAPIRIERDTRLRVIAIAQSSVPAATAEVSVFSPSAPATRRSL